MRVPWWNGRVTYALRSEHATEHPVRTMIKVVHCQVSHAL